MSLQYHEIQSKYPKAWAKARRWQIDKGPTFTGGSPRWLFDFFDQQGILTEIRYLRSAEFFPTVWAYHEGVDKLIPHGIDLDASTTRQEAESAAFTKAFELLEEKL